MIEHCSCCLAAAPSWGREEYSEWHLGLSPSGAYLGIICPACFIDEELHFVMLPAG